MTCESFPPEKEAKNTSIFDVVLNIRFPASSATFNGIISKLSQSSFTIAIFLFCCFSSLSAIISKSILLESETSLILFVDEYI